MCTKLFARLFLTLAWVWLAAGLPAQLPTQPLQLVGVPGGTDYPHYDVWFQDYGDGPGGFWLFEPQAPTPDSADVVIFLHAYGAYNPMVYGKWIKHLVLQGNIVIFPRYQKDLLRPRTGRFDRNAAQAIRAALTLLERPGHVRPRVQHISLIGHSYGGVIAANLAVGYRAWELPQPRAALLCASGTNVLKGGALRDYAALPEDLLLLLVVGEKDRVTSDGFSRKVFRQAQKVRQRNLLIQRADQHGVPVVSARHHEPYAIDWAFDSGDRSPSIQRTLRTSSLDVVDYNGYWKLFDALTRCQREGAFCDWAFGGGWQQRTLGYWSDGTPILGMEAMLPDSLPEEGGAPPEL